MFTPHLFVKFGYVPILLKRPMLFPSNIHRYR